MTGNSVKTDALPEVPETPAEALSVALALELPEAWKTALRSLYTEPRHEGTDGALHVITTVTGITAQQGYEILRLVSEHSLSRTMEIGCANGVSTLWILGGLLGRGLHTAVDPFQTKLWKGIGLHKVKEAACEKNFRFIEDYSAGVLTELGNKGEKFDLIFVDGDHKFDGVMVDINVSDKILEVGGFLIFDDTAVRLTERCWL